MAMTAFVHGTSAATTPMDVPQTLSTAPVLEFRCLYTQDLRRKQKRWQDGRLKFHTFNKRVMVYDERSNFVGDTHWREDSEFNEGEELELERGGILVEVGECVGKRDHDLTELVDKRVKEREERVAAKAGVPTLPRPAASFIRTQGTPAPLRPKPLNEMLTPSGHYGKALVPKTSPLDERQRSNSINPDGIENERPAKRRKQNNSVSSKSGYAQHLMGAALTFTSSRPPSTASIRYEPVIARPTVSQPQKTIDLARDDDSGSEGKKNSSRDERDPRERPKKIQRRHVKSPARGGYATSLSGAALALSRPEDIPSNRVTKSQTSRVPAKGSGQELDESSSSNKETGFVDIEPPKKRPVITAVRPVESAQERSKPQTVRPTLRSRSSSPAFQDRVTPIGKSRPTEPAREKNKPQRENTKTHSRSSSPVVPDRVTPILKPTASLQSRPRQDSSHCGPMPEQPVSALRIKARPPRKMMMLMERPSSRSSPQIESFSRPRTTPKPVPIAQPVTNEVVLSQATMQLNSFCQKQEEKLQARFKSKRHNLELEELSSYPADSGIDHREIDLLLSRKSVPVEKTPPTVSKELSGQNVVLQSSKSATQELEYFPVIETHGSANITSPNCDANLQADSEQTIRIPTDDERGPEDSLKEDGAVPAEADTPLNPKVQGQDEFESREEVPPLSTLGGKPTRKTDCSDMAEKDIITQRHLPTEARDDELSVPKPMPATNDIVEEFASNAKRPFTHSADPPTSNVSTSRRTKTSVSQHVNNAIQSVADMASLPLADLSAEQVQPSVPRVNDNLKMELGSGTVAVKLSPKSSPLIDEIPNGGRDAGEVVGFSTASGLVDAFEVPIAPVLASNNPSMAPPSKVRLVNPATRGRSLHTLAASAVDMRVPVFNPLGPRPPPITNQPRTSVVMNERVAGRAAAASTVAKIGPDGPWSRESFDLFGSWRPPGRDAGTNVSNGLL